MGYPTWVWPAAGHAISSAASAVNSAGHSYVNWSHNPTGAHRPQQHGFLAPIGQIIPRPAQGGGHHSNRQPLQASRPRPSSPSAGTPNRGGGSGASRGGSVSQGAGGTSNAPSRTVRRPLTFTDAHGNVHRIRRTSTAGQSAAQAKPVKDPLEALVDEMLAGQALPLENDKKALVEQSAGNVNQLNRLHDFYGNQVEGVRTGANADFGAMLQRAAELKGISADTIAKNQEWLRSLAGPSNGGTLDAQAGQSGAETLANVAGANDSLARDISAQGTSLNDTMAQLEVAGRAAQRDAVQQEMLARQAGVREADRNIAELRAKRPEMLYQMRQQAADQALKQQVAEAEWGLKQAQANSLDSYRQGQLALSAGRLELAAQNANKPPKPGTPGRYGNLPKRYESVIDGIYSKLQTIANSEDGIQRPWTQAFEQLSDHGIPKFAAARLATNWYGDYAREHSSPKHMLSLVAGLSAAQQRNIIDSIFGSGAYKKATSNFLDPVAGVINNLPTNR